MYTPDLEKKENLRCWEEKREQTERKRPASWPPESSFSLSPSTFPSFFSPSFFLQSYLCKPSNYSNEWLRARQREAVRDWEERAEGGWRKRFITAFYLPWVSLIPRSFADWSVKINSRDQMSGPGVFSVVIQALCACWCVGKWACAFKWKCNSRATIIQSTFMYHQSCVWTNALVNPVRCCM